MTVTGTVELRELRRTEKREAKRSEGRGVGCKRHRCALLLLSCVPLLCWRCAGALLLLLLLSVTVLTTVSSRTPGSGEARAGLRPQHCTAPWRQRQLHTAERHTQRRHTHSGGGGG